MIRARAILISTSGLNCKQNSKIFYRDKTWSFNVRNLYHLYNCEVRLNLCSTFVDIWNNDLIQWLKEDFKTFETFQ